jgi:hypothetical protein
MTNEFRGSWTIDCMITKFDSTSNPDRIERLTYRYDPVLSENHIRMYWWCRPDKIGMATMTPDRWTARPRGASLPNAKCVRA